MGFANVELLNCRTVELDKKYRGRRNSSAHLDSELVLKSKNYLFSLFQIRIAIFECHHQMIGCKNGCSEYADDREAE